MAGLPNQSPSSGKLHEERGSKKWKHTHYYCIHLIDQYFSLFSLCINQGPTDIHRNPSQYTQDLHNLTSYIVQCFFCFILSQSLRPASLPLLAHVVEKEKAVVAALCGAQVQPQGFPQDASIPRFLHHPKLLGHLHPQNGKCTHNLGDIRHA